MDVEQLSCVVDDLPPAKLTLPAKMDKALSLLKDSLGSGCFLAQFWAPVKPGGLQNQPYPHLCVPNSTLLEYRQLDERYKFWERFSGQDILGRTWIYGYKFPEWTSNASYYRPDEYAHLSDAISCGGGGIIAFLVFESDQPYVCCAVLELVTMEEKQDFDLETEKVVQALQFMFAEIAPPNSQMTREFRSKLLSQFPHMNGDLLCFSCYAQTLELLARDGFYEIKDVLNKIRGCIEYVKATPINQDKFQKATNHVKLQDMKAASHDDPTRWDTTFVMLMSALELREAFTQLEQVDFDFKVNPSAESGRWRWL
ncbi:hypothetical protein NC651_036295 [Populus alba x Populus x berolinensis]|nr:hypothetical protein NC651_036295 [Populus alba x Populus x berolinensis]